MMRASNLAMMVCVTVLLGACARINPGFADDKAAEGSGGTDSGTSVGTTSPGSTTANSDSQGTATNTTAGSSGPQPGDSSSGPAESTEGSSTSGGTMNACDQSPEASARFEVLVGDVQLRGRT